MIGISDQSPDDVRDEVSAANAGGTSLRHRGWRGSPRIAPICSDVVIVLATPFVSTSYGDVRTLGAPLRAAGITVATQIGTVDEADEAVERGFDVIVARGSEGGGHGRDAVATLPLLEAVLDSVDVPVSPLEDRHIAWNGRVLAAGAVGAWVGTAFLGCPETAWSSDAAIKGLAADLDARSTRTCTNRDATAVALASTEGGGAQPRSRRRGTVARTSSPPRHRCAPNSTPGRRRPRRLDQSSVWAGQAVGLVTAERSVADVVSDFAGAETLLRGGGASSTPTVCFR